MFTATLARVRGVAHRPGGLCEDAAGVCTLTAPGGRQLLLALAADGAGSALQGATGAHIAVRSQQTAITRLVATRGFPTAGDIHRWLAEVKANLDLTARRFDLTPRDFACTVLGALWAEDGEVALWQLGDGAIVAQATEWFGLAFIPDTGRYANQTKFLSDADALAQVQVHVGRHPSLTGVALMTDGLQGVSIHGATLTPHAPFFTPLFTDLGAIPSGMDRRHRLRQFLDGPALNARTDDDKTLLLAWRA